MIKCINEILKHLALLLIIFFLVTACTHWAPRVNRYGLPERKYIYQVPENTSDGWETAALVEEGVEPKKIDEMMHEIIRRNSRNIHSIVLIKNGRLILEEYFYGYDRDTKHFLASVSKSVTSLIVGIVIDKNFATGVETKAYEFFPSYKGTKWIDQKYPISLKHMLTMSAGLDWDAISYSRTDPRQTTHQMYDSSDPVKFVLERNAIDTPGEKFNYNSGLTILLGEAVRNTSGMYIDEFSGKFLFSPLGISDYHWDKFPDGTIQTDGGLHLRPRDMAKIGYMMLKKGSWQGQQIISREWVEESTKTHINGLGLGYGYQWWRGKTRINNQTINVLYASGHGGQKIFIIPQLDLVAVFTSKVFNPKGHSGPEHFLIKYIIPAMVVTEPPLKTIKLDPDLLDKLTGKYKFKDMDVVVPVFREGDRLYTKTSFWEKVELLPERKNRFFGFSKNIGDFQVDVINDEKGGVKQLIAHFALRSMQLDKVE